ncbi:hypothetical protein GCM10010199_68360 [Dactylosporangium roseum]
MKVPTPSDHWNACARYPTWLSDPPWDQFAALLPPRPAADPTHPLGCHRRRIADRIVFDKLLRVLRFGCSYEAIADTTCSASAIRNRRDEWLHLDLADASITIRSLIRQAWTLCRWDTRPTRRP